jgi:hypothetical protein
MLYIVLGVHLFKLHDVSGVILASAIRPKTENDPNEFGPVRQS